MAQLNPAVVDELIAQIRAHLARQKSDELVEHMLQEVTNALEGEFYLPMYLQRLGEVAASPNTDARIGAVVLGCVVLRLAFGQSLNAQYESLLKSAYDLLILPGI